MDIDHHNPTLPHPAKNKYQNLFLATRHCNGKKGKSWPSAPQRAAGIRFLNPCEEMDYGVHLFEDPVTFEIWGATRAGKYHIRMLDLNAPHLVEERRTRDKLRAFSKKTQVVSARRTDARDGVRSFLEAINKMIPPIPQRSKPCRPSQQAAI